MVEKKKSGVSKLIKLVSPEVFKRTNKLFLEASPKKGGSPGSADVIKLVTPATFEALNSRFTNTISLKGGKRTALEGIDINDTSGTKMMVFNKSGGKKRTTKPKVAKGGATTAPPAAAAAAAAPTGITASSSWIPASITNALNNMNTTTGWPPASVPSKASSPLNNTKSIPPMQKSLTTQEINTLNPIVKSTVYPKSPQYSGNFAFGGAKKTRTTKPKKSKK